MKLNRKKQTDSPFTDISSLRSLLLRARATTTERRHFKCVNFHRTTTGSLNADSHIRFPPFVTFAASLSPAALLAVITTLLVVMLSREQDSLAVLHSWTLGVRLLSYTV